MNKIWFVVAIFVIAMSAIAFAIPEQIAVQGKITGNSNEPLSGSHAFSFRIYDAATGGSMLKESNQTLITKSGIFTAYLDLNLPFDEQYYLETIVNDQILSPRIRMTSSGYAYMAKSVEGLTIPTVSDVWVNTTGDTMSGILKMLNNIIMVNSEIMFSGGKLTFLSSGVVITSAPPGGGINPPEPEKNISIYKSYNTLKVDGSLNINGSLNTIGLLLENNSRVCTVDNGICTTLVQDNWVNTTGDTMNGDLQINADLSVSGNITEDGYRVCTEGNELCAASTVTFIDTNASTACNGTTTYLDGDGECDDISTVYAATTHVQAVNKGGTGLSSSTEDAVLVGNGTTTWNAKTLPNCAGTANKLLYNTSDNNFYCGTDQDTTGVIQINTETGLVGGPITTTGTISLNTTYTNNTYVNEGQSASITSSMLQDGSTLSEILDDDGTSSGLDADMLDGVHSNGFATSTHNHDATYVNVDGDTMTGKLILRNNTPGELALQFLYNSPPIDIAANKIIGNITFSGNDSFGYRIGSMIIAKTDGLWNTGDANNNYLDTNVTPTRIEFYTQNKLSTNALESPRMTIDSNGTVNITENLTVGGNLNTNNNLTIGTAGAKLYYDTNAGALRSSSNFYSDANIVSALGNITSNNWLIATSGLKTNNDAFKILFGSNEDTNLYRSAPNTLKTDDNLTIAGGTINIGSDTNLYKSGTNTLKTDDNLTIGGNLTVDGKMINLGNVGTQSWIQYNTTGGIFDFGDDIRANGKRPLMQYAVGYITWNGITAVSVTAPANLIANTTTSQWRKLILNCTDGYVMSGGGWCSSGALVANAPSTWSASFVDRAPVNSWEVGCEPGTNPTVNAFVICAKY